MALDIVQVDERFAVARFEPDREVFSQIAEIGFRTLVSMQADAEARKLDTDEEARLAEEVGLGYLHMALPQDGLDDASADTFREQVELMPAPFLVHCTSGARSGAVVVVHIACQRDLSAGEAVELAHERGLPLGEAEEAFVRAYLAGRRA